MASGPRSRQWRKSSYSGGEGGNCIELHDTLTKIRDSKNSAVLPLTRRAVSALLNAVRAN